MIALPNVDAGLVTTECADALEDGTSAFVVLRGLRMPVTAAEIPHLVIGPTGVWPIVGVPSACMGDSGALSAIATEIRSLRAQLVSRVGELVRYGIPTTPLLAADLVSGDEVVVDGVRMVPAIDLSNIIINAQLVIEPSDYALLPLLARLVQRRLQSAK